MGNPKESDPTTLTKDDDDDNIGETNTNNIDEEDYDFSKLTADIVPPTTTTKKGKKSKDKKAKKSVFSPSSDQEQQSIPNSDTGRSIIVQTKGIPQRKETQRKGNQEKYKGEQEA